MYLIYQAIPKIMKTGLHFILILLTLTSCSVSKHWKSDQTESSFSASYEDFNGKEEIHLKKNITEVAYLSYYVRNSTGKFSLNINRDDFDFIPDSLVHSKVSLVKPLKIELQGNRANGDVQIEYPKFERKDIHVQYNANFELLCLAYFLSEVYDDVKDNHSVFNYNEQEVQVKELYALNVKIASRFETFEESENLKILKEFFTKNWYLEYTNFVMNLGDIPNAKYAGDTFTKSDSKLFGSKEEAERFISALNNFYREINFDEFLKDYKSYYVEMLNEVKSNLPDEGFITEMEHVYNKKATGYFLNASLTMPFSQGYGVTIDKRIGYVFGALVLPTDFNSLKHLSLGYADKLQLRNISVHEFGHSFVNPVVDQVSDSIIEKKKFLYEPIQQEMSDQAYTTWKTTLYEHFVRAGEIFIANQLGDHKTAQKLTQDYIENRHFVYLNQIIPAMENWYNNNYFKKSYADFVKETIGNLTNEKI